MSFQDLIANSLKGSFDMVLQHIEGFSDADFLVRPVPAANHALWQLGHLAASNHGIASAIGATPAPLPAGFADKFKKENAGIDDAKFFPNKTEILAVLKNATEAGVARIKAMKPEDFAAPSPKGMEWVPTVGDLAMILPDHLYMHMGQFQVLRRKLGKPVLF